jgi:hypothetical protein
MTHVTKDEMTQALDVLQRLAEMTNNPRASKALTEIRSDADEVEQETNGGCMREGYALAAVLSALY